MDFKTCLLLLTALSGALGQLPFCPSFASDRDACALTHIPNLNGTRDAVTAIEAMYVGSAFVTDATNICLNLAAVKAFVVCVDTAVRGCVPAAFQQAFPTIQQLNHGLDYLCQNIAGVDLTCYSTRFAGLSTCIGSTLSFGNHNQSLSAGYISSFCDSSHTTAACLYAVYRGCPNSMTGEILEHAIEMILPKGCDGSIHYLSLLLMAAVSIFHIVSQ